MKVIPFGDRILVKRKIVGEKAGSLFLPDDVKDRMTDLAEVVYIPDLTLGDKHILDNAQKIVEEITKKAGEGNSDCLIALLRLNEFLRIKSINVGDRVFISKYVGTDFHETGNTETLTLVKAEDIIGLVIE